MVSTHFSTHGEAFLLYLAKQKLLCSQDAMQRPKNNNNRVWFGEVGLNVSSYAHNR